TFPDPRRRFDRRSLARAGHACSPPSSVPSLSKILKRRHVCAPPARALQALGIVPTSRRWFMRRFLLSTVGVFVAVIALDAGFLWSQATYHGIRTGWTERDVQVFLGRPPDQPRAPPWFYGFHKLRGYGSSMAIWDAPQSVIVLFDRADRVTF